MFSSLRDRLTRRRGEDHLSGPQAAPGSSVPDDPCADDPVLARLAEELGGLGPLDLPAAPRERTWALVRAEVARQKAGAASARAQAAAGRRFGRLALAGAALVAAVTLGLVGLTGGFGGSEQTAESSSTSGSVVADGGPTTDTQGPGTTTDTQGPGPTPTSTQPGTSSSLVPPRTDLPPSTVPPSPGSTGTTPHGGSGPTVPSTSPEPRTSTTTAPATTTTPEGGLMTARERESFAQTLARSLADKLVTGDLSGADALVTGAAHRGLVWLRGTLHEPFGHRVLSSEATASGARVLLEMLDRVPDADGDGLIEVRPRFILEMQVEGDDSLVITRIYKDQSE